MWQKIISAIQNNQKFVITAHVNPDCDALGSELALAAHLRRLGKQAVILNTDSTPPAYKFLDTLPRRSIRKYAHSKHRRVINQAQIIFVLDASGGWERVGRVGEALQQAPALKICIDHHPDATDFANIAAIDTNAAATAELVFDLIEAMDGQITPHIAQALYAAIITDTGNFRFPKTNPHTHQITAKLLAAGVDPAGVYQQLYEQYPLGRVKLKGHLLNTLQTTANGRVVFYGLARDTLKAFGVKASDLDGFASLGQEIGGVCVTIFCLETAAKQIKISLRSNGRVAINQIAAGYNGGGHPSAAGATVSGPLEEVLADVTAKVRQLLETHP